MTTAVGAMHTLRFDAIGTPWQIDTREVLAPAQTGAIHALIEDFDRAYSRFRSDSLVRHLAEHGGSVEFPADIEPMLAVFDALVSATDGRMTPLVGASLERLGYDARYSLHPSGEPLPSPSWDRIRLDGRTLIATEPVLLDVGAAGKGYLADLVADELERLGATGVVVDASGDLVTRSGAPLRVALEHPYDSRRAIGVVEIDGGAICGSATTRRAWGEGLHHVLDGATGQPVDRIVATWAVAADGLHADALATALFFADADTLRTRTGWDFEAVRMMTDGRVEVTEGLPGEVFTE